ncbi:hypothetical protein VP01_108g4 [Puccinia sorghi]|uniref:SP-RING-type domain-containing protein n=1 Tax=Puccinia sorghi TaxID=27349 RepID=A0A0L6VTD7_9BASI|nr:hypothetical protein VP01_108g4 [Puccinia sorghi]
MPKRERTLSEETMRSEEFWETFDANILMLDLVRRKLTTENLLLEASNAFIEATKNGELLVMEFMPHLAGFCEKIVDWYDEPRLSTLDRGHLRALFKVIKSIKKTTEAGKSAIISHSVQVSNPSELYQHAYNNIVEDYTKFEEIIRKELRRRVHPNAQPAGVRTREAVGGRGQKEAERSSLDVEIKVTSSESESDSTESDDSPGPFGRAIRRKPPAQRTEDKPKIPGISLHGTLLGSSNHPIEIDEKPTLCSDKKEPSPSSDSEDFTRSSTPEENEQAPRIKTSNDKSRHEIKGRASPSVKSEEEHEEPSANSAEIKKGLTEDHQLNSNVLGDLWITHKVLKSCKITDKTKEFPLRLSESVQFSYPRFALHQSSLTRPEDGDEIKALPFEMVIFVDLKLGSNKRPSDNPAEDLKFTINSQELRVHTSHIDGSSVKLVIPVHPQYLKSTKEKNTMRITESNRSSSRLLMNGRMSVHVVTMMSEEEIFKRAMQLNCSDRRRKELIDACTSPLALDSLLVDPLAPPRLIRCPVRGGQCQHLQCFDLKAFIERNRFKDGWTCPVNGCNAPCSPFELEFDEWLYANICRINQASRST